MKLKIIFLLILLMLPLFGDAQHVPPPTPPPPPPGLPIDNYAEILFVFAMVYGIVKISNKGKL